MPRLFRQSPVNGVWEGSGNVICLDVLRALAREPDALDAYWSEVGRRRRAATPAWHGPSTTSTSTWPIPATARAAGPFGRRADGAGVPGVAAGPVRTRGGVADAFCASRLGAERGRHLRHPPGRGRHRPPSSPGTRRSDPRAPVAGPAGRPAGRPHARPDGVDRPLGPARRRRHRRPPAGRTPIPPASAGPGRGRRRRRSWPRSRARSSRDRT